jgi:hypothetical protein
MERRLLSVAARIFAQTFGYAGKAGRLPGRFVRMRTPFAVRDNSRFLSDLVA